MTVLTTICCGVIVGGLLILFLAPAVANQGIAREDLYEMYKDFLIVNGLEDNDESLDDFYDFVSTKM